MTVKAIIFDVSETLINGGKPVTGVPEMLALCRRLGLRVVAAMNDPRWKLDHTLADAGLSHYFDVTVSRSDVAGRKAKGSPVWVDALKERIDFEAREMVYVGDSHLDMVTALRGPMPYFHAGWSPKKWDGYGITVPTVPAMHLLIEHVVTKDWQWTYQGSSTDPLGRKAEHRSLVIAGSKSGVLEGPLVNYLKHGVDSIIGGDIEISLFVRAHLAISLFAEDLFGARFITTMPGHEGDTNATLAPISRLLSQLQGSRYSPTLIRRHTASKRSNQVRKQDGLPAAWQNQFSTLDIPEPQKVIGSRVLVLDDYLTRGPTLEAARVLLLEAGASAVTLVSVGKFPGNIYVTDLGVGADQDFAAARSRESRYTDLTDSDKKLITSYEQIKAG